MRWAILAVALMGLVGCNKPASTDAGPSPDKKPERAPLEGRVELEELAGAYRTNEAAAEEKYGNRRVTVEGAMKKLTKTDAGYVMTFEHGANLGSQLPVAAYFPASAGSDLAKLEFRSPVLFSGVCIGWEKNVVPTAVALRNCKLEQWPKTGAAPPKDDAKPKVMPKVDAP